MLQRYSYFSNAATPQGDYYNKIGWSTYSCLSQRIDRENLSDAFKKGFHLVVAEVAGAGNVAGLVESSCTACPTADVANGTVAALLNVVDIELRTPLERLAVAIDVDYSLLVHVSCQELVHVQQLAGIYVARWRYAYLVVANGALASLHLLRHVERRLAVAQRIHTKGAGKSLIVLRDRLSFIVASF